MTGLELDPEGSGAPAEIFMEGRDMVSDMSLIRITLTAVRKKVSTDASSLRKADPKGRSALLADIQQGTRLRKVTQINDRSAPQIESSKGTNKEGGGPTNSRGGSTPPALGDLFAGGFPVLRPAGQRDAAGGKTGQGPGSRVPSPRLPTKTISGPFNPPASPRLGDASEAHGVAGTVPPRPSMPAPPPPPLPPALPPSSPAKAPLVSPPGPPTKGSAPVLAPPLPCAPPPPYAPRTPRASLPAPPLPGANDSGEVPPPRPPKSPCFQAHPPEPSAQALPVPPALPGSQTFLPKKRPGRGPGSGGGKLNPPPAPPARSPTTELSSRSQQAPAWTLTQQPGGQLRNGSLHIIDDFESKFTFHSMEDFPPPDEYKPCQKIYPSKIPRSRTPGPWLHTEAAGQSSDDIKGRNAQLSLKTLR
ncbi:PREDICTED: WAS/WASL-interacting protein family member 3 [Lipotes vexillifer]|uniref:WAS/WASL-interacting protein family member 3 n=1 Tax=Lipotes vexillifer TaxID=118797 RepID=A0A340Y3G2_LIPVE|nr:PREDICTED: WAS/WASL-interacting protein family member 3 [Lipotes vexillifer]